jgi:hypothetical protein
VCVDVRDSDAPAAADDASDADDAPDADDASADDDDASNAAVAGRGSRWLLCRRESVLKSRDFEHQKKNDQHLFFAAFKGERLQSLRHSSLRHSRSDFPSFTFVCSVIFFSFVASFLSSGYSTANFSLFFSGLLVPSRNFLLTKTPVTWLSVLFSPPSYLANLFFFFPHEKQLFLTLFFFLIISNHIFHSLFFSLYKHYYFQEVLFGIFFVRMKKPVLSVRERKKRG